MPGPGGPQGAGAGAAAAGNADDDDGSLQDHVLVAAFPDVSPEVHVASLEPERALLKLREASVGAGGEVALGATRTVDFADVGSMDSTDGVIALLGHDNHILVQMHFETNEDLQIWASGLRALINSRSGGTAAGGGGEPAEEDVHMLQAQSQQLQNRIGALEAISKRRDAHLKKMLRRLDGAMQMLAAVQDMCAQQKRVLDAQKVAIVELRRECGESTEEDADGAEPTVAEPEGEAEEAESEDVAAEAAGGAERDAAVAEAEAQIAAKTKQMLDLLQQADEMQRVLRQLQEMQGEEEADTTPALHAEAVSPAAPAQALQPSVAPAAPCPGAATTESTGEGPAEESARARDGEAVEAAEDEQAGDGQAVLNRLQHLQAEKERFEGMFRESQMEHEDLLRRLNDMRSLMNALGMQEDGPGSGSSTGDADSGNERGTNGPAAAH